MGRLKHIDFISDQVVNISDIILPSNEEMDENFLLELVSLYETAQNVSDVLNKSSFILHKGPEADYYTIIDGRYRFVALKMHIDQLHEKAMEYPTQLLATYVVTSDSTIKLNVLITAFGELSFHSARRIRTTKEILTNYYYLITEHPEILSVPLQMPSDENDDPSDAEIKVAETKEMHIGQIANANMAEILQVKTVNIFPHNLYKIKLLSEEEFHSSLDGLCALMKNKNNFNTTVNKLTKCPDKIISLLSDETLITNQKTFMVEVLKCNWFEWKTFLIKHGAYDTNQDVEWHQSKIMGQARYNNYPDDFDRNGLLNNFFTNYRRPRYIDMSHWKRRSTIESRLAWLKIPFDDFMNVYNVEADSQELQSPFPITTSRKRRRAIICKYNKRTIDEIENDILDQMAETGQAENIPLACNIMKYFISNVSELKSDVLFARAHEGEIEGGRFYYGPDANGDHRYGTPTTESNSYPPDLEIEENAVFPKDIEGPESKKIKRN